MKGDNFHTGLGTEPRTPIPSTRGWIRVVERGCGGTRDYWGEYDCSHGYGWTCDDCPWRIEHYDK